MSDEVFVVVDYSGYIVGVYSTREIAEVIARAWRIRLAKAGYKYPNVTVQARVVDFDKIPN